MLYAVVAYPDIDFGGVNKFRQMYDPHVDLIKPHITIVFPFNEGISENKIISHIENRIKEMHPFQVSFSGYDKFFDHWLYLIVSKGSQEIRFLHDSLYTDIFEQFLRKDLPFIPHMAIGLFSKKYVNSVSTEKVIPLDEIKYQTALKEINNMTLSFGGVIKEITLVKLNEEFSVLKDIKNFNL